MWLYKTIFYLSSILIKAKNTNAIKNIWYRNSLKFNNIVFGKSDIDYTIHLLANNDFKKIQAYFKKLKRIFPVMGEINAYADEDLINLEGYFNPYELARDPELTNVHPNLASAESKEAKIVFLIKMMRADRRNLTTKFNSRKKKWNFHFMQLGLGPLPDSLKEMLFAIENKFNIPKKYLMLNLSNENYIPMTDYNDPQFLIYFPVDWLYHTLLNLEFEKNLSIVRQLNFSEQSILIYQFSWELMGLTGQYRSIESREQFLNHVQNMVSVLTEMATSEANECAKRLAVLSKNY